MKLAKNRSDADSLDSEWRRMYGNGDDLRRRPFRCGVLLSARYDDEATEPDALWDPQPMKIAT